MFIDRFRLLRGLHDALQEAYAVVEFDMTGKVLSANDNFLGIVGYSESEVIGQSYPMFVDLKEVLSSAYADFWDRLRRGERQTGEFRRIGKGGKELWLQSSYNPIAGRSGRPVKVVAIATDVTPQRLVTIEAASQIDAVGRSLCVVHFEPNGTILSANEKFLDLLGYSLDDVRGKRHEMFVTEEERNGSAYYLHWSGLSRGEYQSGQFMRLTRDGKPVWLQATYTPVIEPDSGRVIKIVKFATDISAQIIDRKRREELQLDIDKDLTAMSRALRSINEKTGAAASSSFETNGVIATIASSAEEMSASFAGIGEQVAHAAAISSLAVKETGSTNTLVDKLIVTARRIEEILALIHSIAGKTNLLALNATIEAARAGESGRGFAVVAAEVKQLAQQTKQATDDIADHIAGVQSASAGVSSAISGVAKTISELNAISGTLATSIVDQLRAAQEMSQNIQATAGTVNEITTSISQISAQTSVVSDGLEKLNDVSKKMVA